MHNGLKHEASNLALTVANEITNQSSFYGHLYRNQINPRCGRYHFGLKREASNLAVAVTNEISSQIIFFLLRALFRAERNFFSTFVTSFNSVAFQPGCSRHRRDF